MYQPVAQSVQPSTLHNSAGEPLLDPIPGPVVDFLQFSQPGHVPACRGLSNVASLNDALAFLDLQFGQFMTRQQAMVYLRRARGNVMLAQDLWLNDATRARRRRRELNSERRRARARRRILAIQAGIRRGRVAVTA